MAKLIFSAITSLDGFIEDETGHFDWAEPDAEVMTHVNDLERSFGTYLYGRRMYETLVYWETEGDQPDSSEGDRDFAEIWRAADKVVYSTSLASASSAKTEIVRQFDPDIIQKMKDELPCDLSVGGPNLAAQAFRAGLVDECQLFLLPVAVGRGKSALPSDVRLDLELLDERRFSGGAIYLHYRVRP
jgi:dihydrofolate reductase